MADRRAGEARTAEAQALDAESREAFAREAQLHESAAATHRRAALLQRTHLEHEQGV